MNHITVDDDYFQEDFKERYTKMNCSSVIDLTVFVLNRSCLESFCLLVIDDSGRNGDSYYQDVLLSIFELIANNCVIEHN